MLRIWPDLFSVVSPALLVFLKQKRKGEEMKSHCGGKRARILEMIW